MYGSAFGRYADVDGDGIPYRTLPGTDHPLASYFTRGSGHNEHAVYSERPDDYKHNMDRLNKKYDTARSHVPQPEVQYAKGASVGVLAFGTTHWAIIESLDQLQREFEKRVATTGCAQCLLRKTLLNFLKSMTGCTSSNRIEMDRWPCWLSSNCRRNLSANSAASGTTAAFPSTPVL